MSRSDYKNLRNGYLDNTRMNLIRREQFREKFEPSSEISGLIDNLLVKGDDGKYLPSYPGGFTLDIFIYNKNSSGVYTLEKESYYFDVVGYDANNKVYTIKVKNNRITRAIKRNDTDYMYYIPSFDGNISSSKVLDDVTKEYTISYKYVRLAEKWSKTIPRFLYHFIKSDNEMIHIDPFSPYFLRFKPTDMNECMHKIYVSEEPLIVNNNFDTNNRPTIFKDYTAYMEGYQGRTFLQDSTSSGFYYTIPVESRNKDCVASSYGDFVYNPTTNLYESSASKFTQIKACGGKECEIRTRPIQDSDCCVYDKEEIYDKDQGMMVKKNRLNNLPHCSTFQCDSSKNISRSVTDGECCSLDRNEIYDNGKMVTTNSKKTPVLEKCANYTCVNRSRSVDLNKDCHVVASTVKAPCSLPKPGKPQPKTELTTSYRINTSIPQCSNVANKAPTKSIVSCP